MGLSRHVEPGGKVPSDTSRAWVVRGGGDEDERQVSFVGNIGFIGEAFSGDFWGYMEGAVQTGWMSARHVVDELV